MRQEELYIHAPLIEECRKGSRMAQFSLYRQYSKAMFNLAYRMTNNREDAEDILQETFTECFRNIDSFRFESTFGAWLKTILINRSINFIKKKKINLVYPSDLPDKQEEETDEPEYNRKKSSEALKNFLTVTGLSLPCTFLKDMIIPRFHKYSGSRNQPQNHSIRGQKKNSEQC